MREKRRSSGQLRIPYVRRCEMIWADGAEEEAFLVNVNVLGAFVANDTLPKPGERLTCRFALPDSEHDVQVAAIVAWVNAQQNHPVHSLPRGYGVRFQDLSPEDFERIRLLVEDYVARHPGMR
jgi:Tfp pilus assembly protein PilZ